ncbi:hypothetical protein D9M71_268680 [compost metagenome]
MLAGATDRLRDLEKRLAELADLHRACQHALDRPLQHLGQVRFPGAYIRLCAGHGDAAGIGGQREDAMAPGEPCGHQAGEPGKVDLQGIDMQVRLASLPGQPLAQGTQVQALAGIAQVGKLLAGDPFEWVLLVLHGRADVAIIRADALIGHQLVKQGAEVKPAIFAEVVHACGLPCRATDSGGLSKVSR